ncbi:hypothetical protein AZSI13_16140 [Azospira sp. I13]|jgi:hypothetical protein|uniref:hypothetical protein n=1 Tax=Azospira sp. I13 TaxID=1765050 RepID=UPI000D46EC48|nr:hypothetical protein [Azospira sp. I13]GBG02287.1 hypothetical protein AZSI13_16140 [Azospira sp. I13]
MTNILFSLRPVLRKHFAVPFLALMLLAGCATTAQWAAYEVPGETKAILARQAELERPGLDLSQATIIRLKSGDVALEVNSFMSLVLKNQAFGWAYAKSLMSFDESRKNLRLFTFDVKRNKAYQTQIPVAELQPGKSFTFPILGKDGFAEDMTFTVERVIVQ